MDDRDSAGSRPQSIVNHPSSVVHRPPDESTSGLKRLTSRALIYIVADVLNRGGAILLIPLYTWFMSPDDYGILALASLINSFLVMLLSFGGASVVLRFYHQFSNQEERARFLGGFWLFLIVVPGALIGGALALGEPILGNLFRQMPFHPYVELICISAYLNVAFGTVLPNLYRAREQAGRYLALSAATMLATVALTLFFVVYERGGAAGALGAQCLAAYLVSVVSTWLLFREVGFPAIRGEGSGVGLGVSVYPRRGGSRTAPTPTPTPTPTPNPSPLASLGAALRYGLPLIPHFAAHWTLSISNRAILERFVSIGSLGIYSLAAQFGTMLQMLTTSVNQAIIPAFSRAARDHRERSTLGRLSTYYFLAVAVLSLLVASTAKDLIYLMTPPAYHEAAQLVPVIALGIAAMGFYSIPMNLLSMTAGKTGAIPLITGMAAGLNVALNLILVPRMGIVAAAINTAIGYGALAVLTTAYAKRVISLNYEVGRIAKIALGSLLVYAVGVLPGNLGPALGLLVHLSLAALLPGVLWLLGFWTREEKTRISRLIPLRIRGKRYHPRRGLGEIGHS